MRFYSGLFSVDINLLLKPKPFKDEKTGVSYSPNENCQKLSDKFAKEIQKVVSSDLYKSLYKNKVIYHPFYTQ